MAAIKNTIPRGIRNNNPLNIRVGNNWKGEVANPTDKQFEQFSTMVDGCRAGFKLLMKYIQKYKLNTVELIINRWAPPSENNTKKYIEMVCENSGLRKNQIIDIRNANMMIKLFQAMVIVENGRRISEIDISMGYAYAMKS